MYYTGLTRLAARYAVSVLLLAAVGPSPADSIVTSVHCHNRKEISPCTCLYRESVRSARAIMVECKDVTSFGQVVTALQGQFERNIEIFLKISHSKLDDLPQLSFSQLGLSIYKLSLNLDNLSDFPETVFAGLGQMEFLSLADNALEAVPHHILNLMPLIKVLDLNGGKINSVFATDLQSLTMLQTVTLASNNISILEQGSLPLSITRLQISNNRITTMNQTLRGMSDLQWLFANGNQLEDLNGELPNVSPNKLTLVSVENNCLKHPPQDLRNSVSLNHLRLDSNQIVSLDGALAYLKSLETLNLTGNQLTSIGEEDFSHLGRLVDLFLSHNQLVHLNRSLTPLKSLRNLYLSHNCLNEFNFQEILGLTRLDFVDLSHNNISQLTGRTENMVELEIKVIELRLEFNKLKSLSGTLMGLHGLKKLNISHNLIDRISPDDFIGLDNLQILDISYNQLTTLDETSKTVLPSLDSLLASHNLVKTLEKDFHGLPKLCWADLRHNQIEDISAELVENTQCQLYGVNSVLRVYLQGNTGLCEPKVLDKLLLMESKNNTKFHISPECYNSLNENISIHPFFKKQ